MLKTASKFVRMLVEIIVIVVLAVALSFVVRTFLVETYEVPSGSMIPTIDTEENLANGVYDRILSEKISYYSGTPQKGDIVTFESPLDNGNTILVKRVIATGGDTVDIRGGNLYINGVLQNEEYVHGKPTNALYPTMPGVEIDYPYTVPEGCIWVMGDNRTNSEDSRYFGPVKTDTVTGRVFFRYMPFDRFGPM